MKINNIHNVYSINKIQKELKNTKKNLSYKYVNVEMNGKKAKLNFKHIKLSRNKKNLKYMDWINKHIDEIFELCSHRTEGGKIQFSLAKNMYTFKGYENLFEFHILDLIIIQDKI